MKKKLMIISMASLLALGGIATVAGTIGAGGSLSLTRAATCDHSDGTERAFYAPGTYTHQNEKGETVTDETGTIPYWRCNTCCASDPSSARFDLSDHTKALSLDEVTIPNLNKVTKDDVSSGDEIANVNVNKFKYVDQGVNGPNQSSKVDGVEDESTPWYVKDSGKTAIYFSRSGISGTHEDPTGNDGCSEFRFTHSGDIASVTFSYRYRSWGSAKWAGGEGGSAPAKKGWTAMCQFYDGTNYEGYAIDDKLQNDDEWHTATISYKEATSKDTTTNFSAFIFKFTDLRGYIMISGLSYETAVDVTLENASADGSSKTETVSVGSLPTTPTMDGKKFLGWYDESGNKVDVVTSSTSKLIARWGTADAQLADYTVEETILKQFNTDSGFSGTGISGKEELEDGVRLYLQETGTQNCMVTFPAFDYKTAGRVDFYLEYNYGTDQYGGAIKNGSYQFAYSLLSSNKVNAHVEFNGSDTNFYIGTTLMGPLEDDVASGKSGLSFTFVRRTTDNNYEQLDVGDFKQYTRDYMNYVKAKASALPATISSENETEAISAYKEYALAYGKAYSSMSSYEKASLTSPEKMTQNSALKGKELSLVTIASGGTSGTEITWVQANELGFYSDAVSYSPKRNNEAYLWLNVQQNGTCGQLSYYFDMPVVNYAAYSKVTFKMFSGQNPKLTVDGKDWADSFSYGGKQNPCTITISTVDGKTTFSDGSNSIELSDEVAKGSKALRFVRTRSVSTSTVQYDNIGFSSFTGTI